LKLVFDKESFKGIITENSAIGGNIIQCDNFDAVLDKTSLTTFFGFLTKFPNKIAHGNQVSTSKSRGMYLFVPDDFASSGNYHILQAFSDSTIRYLTSGGIWSTILTLSDREYYQVEFISWSALNTAFMTNGFDAPYKWKPAWASATELRDKSRTAVALTGNITFTLNSQAVTGSGTAFTTELEPGDWIRKTTTDDWYEVLTIIDNDNLVLDSEYLGTTGAGGAGNSRKAEITDLRGRYVDIWYDRLILVSGDSSGIATVGVTDVGDDDIVV